MGARYKATGCLRFFVVLIILIPLTIMVASYIRGEDGLTNLKNIFKIETLRNLITREDRQTTDLDPATTATMVEDLKARMEELEAENAQLKAENSRLKNELEGLRQDSQ